MKTKQGRPRRPPLFVLEGESNNDHYPDTIGLQPMEFQFQPNVDYDLLETIKV